MTPSEEVTVTLTREELKALELGEPPATTDVATRLLWRSARVKLTAALSTPEAEEGS